MTDAVATPAETSASPARSDVIAAKPSNLKTVWTIIVGLKDVLVLAFMLLFFGFLFMSLLSSPNPAGGQDGALVLKLAGSIVDQPAEASASELLSGQAPALNEHRTRDVIRALEGAVKDDGVKAVVLDLRGFWGGGQVVMMDVAAAMDKVRAAKKPVLVYSEGLLDDGYLLAAHASEVWLHPMGAVAVAGPGGSQPYFKGLLDRFGVNVHIYRVGKYKSAVEPFLLSKQSTESREATQAMIDGLWGEWKANVSRARPKAQLDAAIANPVGQGGELAQVALAYGLIDKIGDDIAFGKRVAEITGNDEEDRPGNFNGRSLNSWLASNPEKITGDAIGIVHIAGTIVDGEAQAGTAGGKTIAKIIRDALANRKLKALVLRVDSPGGSAMASEQIRMAVGEAKAKGLPIIVSMGNVAASGGYWVSMNADKVFAEPSTITGSIGVFGMLPTFEQTAARYGVTADGVQATPLSGQPDILRGTTPELDRYIQGGVESIYSRFLTIVSENRKLPREKVAEIAQGRVWMGGTARQLGLVDAFGSLDDAIAEAAKRAKIAPADVRKLWLDPEPDSWSQLLAGFSGSPASEAPADLFTRMARIQQGRLLAGFTTAGHVMSGPAVQVRCIECPAQPLVPVSGNFFETMLNRGWK